METKTLKMGKGNAWNALKQERCVISDDIAFKTDLMMKQWQFLKGSFKDISCCTYLMFQGKVKFIQTPNERLEVCVQGERTWILSSSRS